MGAGDEDDYLRYARRLRPQEHPEPDYRFLADVHAEIASLVERRPGLISPEQIGETVEGRPIWAFHIRDPGSDPERRLLVFAQIHALEWITTEVAVDFLEEMVLHPPPGVFITVIPVLNVDGRMKVENDLMTGADRYRRGNAPNVDLNRDFAYNRDARAIWRHILPRRYASSPAPLSQPESRAIDALAGREKFDVAISLHSFGGYLYYPWAGLWERPADRDRFEELGQVMQSGQGARFYQVRQLGRWAFFFRGHGMEIDHLYGKYGTKAFLIELSRSGKEIFRPSTWGSSFRIFNPRDPRAEIRRGVGALRALARYLSQEGSPPAPTP